MFIEKNCNPGLIINLDHVISMNWDGDLIVEFVTIDGKVITWKYDTEHQLSEDLDKVGRLLHKSGNLISVELDQK